MIVLLCGAVSLLFVSPRWHRIKIRRPEYKGRVDQAVILDLAAAALASGVSIPTMLQAVHVAMDDPAISTGKSSSLRRGEPKMALLNKHRRSRAHIRYSTLDEVAHMLLMGASWDEAWKNVIPVYRRLGNVLAPAWISGVAPVALLKRGAQSLRFSRARRAKEAAARLGTKLVVPLAVCYLPAFMLIGVLPVVVAAAGKLF